MPFFSLLRKNALVRRSCISKANVTSHNHSDRQRQAGSFNVCIHPAIRDTPLTELYGIGSYYREQIWFLCINFSQVPK